MKTKKKAQNRYTLMRRLSLLLALGILAGCASAGPPEQVPVSAEVDSTVGPLTREEWERRVPENLRDRPAFAYVEEDASLPRVLLIGDSISIGYTPAVRRILAGKANVLRVPTNAGPTTRGLESIDAWLGGEHWDVIHFNWGLHDLKRLKDGNMDVSGEWQVTPEQYRLNLESLVQTLEATGATLIWASTTPVPKGASGRVPGDDVRYNTIATEIMRDHGIVTNDLYGAVAGSLAAYQKPENVHFSEEGSNFLGKRVAAAILEMLSAR
jgi:acyl-CoA thioesterase-1